MRVSIGIRVGVGEHEGTHLSKGEHDALRHERGNEGGGDGARDDRDAELLQCLCRLLLAAAVSALVGDGCHNG